MNSAFQRIVRNPPVPPTRTIWWKSPTFSLHMYQHSKHILPLGASVPISLLNSFFAAKCISTKRCLGMKIELDGAICGSRVLEASCNLSVAGGLFDTCNDARSCHRGLGGWSLGQPAFCPKCHGFSFLRRLNLSHNLKISRNFWKHKMSDQRGLISPDHGGQME